MQWLPLLVLSALSVGASVITRPDPQTTEDNGSAYLLADLFSRATKSWECTNATHGTVFLFSPFHYCSDLTDTSTIDYIVTKDQINSALGHDVPLWKTRSDKRWQGGQSYPHRMRTGAIEGFDLQRTVSTALLLSKSYYLSKDHLALPQFLRWRRRRNCANHALWSNAGQRVPNESWGIASIDILD